MERSNAESKMRCMPLVLFGASFLRPVLRTYKLDIAEGIVLVVDNENKAKEFLSLITNQIDSFQKIDSWNSRSKKIDNYCCGLMLINRTSKEEEVEKFLSESQFLPVVIVGGVMPSYLRNRMHIFRISQLDVDFVQSNVTGETLTMFRDYIIHHISSICELFQEFPTMEIVEDYMGSPDMKGIYSVMAVTGYIFSKFLRSNQTEKQVNAFLWNYLKECEERLQLIPEFGCGMDLPGILSDLVWKYCDDDCDVRIVDIQDIGGDTWTLFHEKKAILFDENYYYFSPEMFRWICNPLLQTISEPELKRQLKQNEIIFCQSGDYTVKKTIVNAYGQVERPRMIWVRREFLCSSDNYWLEDIFG